MKSDPTKSSRPARIYFTDFFDVAPKTLANYGAFNVSPVVDLPLFVDPFLLFTSDKAEYLALHDEMIRYLKFLRDKSAQGLLNPGTLKAWYCFKEVKENCLGFCESGNRGIGLGMSFANALNENLNNLFKDFGHEQVTRGSHLEKLILIRSGVGKDKISDFTTNLIKGFLVRYTEAFAKKHIAAEKRQRVSVSHVEFDYDKGVWKGGTFDLPWLDKGFVLLTPEDILTKDDTWINKKDLQKDFPQIRESIENVALRAQIDQYFFSVLKHDKDKEGKDLEPTKKQRAEAIDFTLRKFPALIDYYIREKENNGDEAVERSKTKVDEVELRFVQNIHSLVQQLSNETAFYDTPENTLDEARRRISYLKHVIEDLDGYRLFYDGKGSPIEREKDLQIAFKLVCIGSPSSVDSEVNNGRGPVDSKFSRGDGDKTLVEFKLASNSKLEQNLENQVKIYEKANRTTQSLKVILFFTEDEHSKVKRVLKSLKIEGDTSIILIDARRDNKPSASKA